MSSPCASIGQLPQSPRSPWGVAASPSFKSLWSYADNPPQESATEKAFDDVVSTWIGAALRKDQGRRFYSAVSRSDGFRSVEFKVGDDVMVLAPDGGLPYIAKIEALFEEVALEFSHQVVQKLMCSQLAWCQAIVEKVLHAS